jgi:hypothetical protein
MSYLAIILRDYRLRFIRVFMVKELCPGILWDLTILQQ